tara:strand:- start:271 stop:390 length:120 start_codon:yes stop_codon:yes gene_type:complete
MVFDAPDIADHCWKKLFGKAVDCLQFFGIIRLSAGQLTI